jgi:N-acyl-D-aspartate/D-glutamate deacylase
MAKKRQVAIPRPIRFPKWMFDALEEIADTKGATFTDVVLDLLRQELKAMGITMGIGREAVEMPVEGESPPGVGKAQ